MSDSCYAAATRHRPSSSTAGRPPSLELISDDWAAATLSDDELDDRYESHIAPLLGGDDEGELALDVDAVVVSTSMGQSGPGGGGAGGVRDRRAEDGRWNDLGLDQLDARGGGGVQHGEERVQGYGATGQPQ